MHTGFLPVWHYETVLSFDIVDGAVVGSQDTSDTVAAYRREQMGAEGEADDAGIFERFLDSIKMRIGLADDATSSDV